MGIAVVALFWVGVLASSGKKNISKPTSSVDAGAVAAPVSPTRVTPLMKVPVGVAQAAPMADAGESMEARTVRENKARFDAMTPADHLVAAQASMAEGYDAKARVGGNLEDAQHHLQAIPVGTPAARQAQSLAREIATRQKRAKTAADQAQNERIANEVLAGMRGEAPVLSAWNGSISEVNSYLREHLNDPDSYDSAGCTEPVAVGDRWIATCRFRARNGFGALILQEWRFGIRQGQVVEARPSE